MKWAVPVIVSILVVGLLYSVDTQTVAGQFCIGGCNDFNPCTIDFCGTSSSFPFLPTCKNNPGNAGTTCSASAGACDVAASCTGTSASCPANAFEPSTTECRASAGACDPAESCTGTSASCPANTFEPSTTECRASAGACDPAESCTGTLASCPADAFEPEGTTCGIPAFGVNQNCDSAGICVPSSAITCGEGTTFNETTLECEANICEATLDVCHKGKTTINISLNALPTHLNHGDTIGACEP